MPQVQEGSFLTLHYRMSGPQGQVIIDTFEGKPATLSLGAGELSPAIEQRLIGLEEGALVRIERGKATALGTARIKIFRHGAPPVWYAAGERLPVR